MNKLMTLVLSVLMVGAAWGAVSTHLSLDNRTGTRVASSTEHIRFSPAWESDMLFDDVATVRANGVVLTNATEEGVFDWKPRQNGTYTLTHVVSSFGQQKGETLSATFEVNIQPDCIVHFHANGGVFSGKDNARTFDQPFFYGEPQQLMTDELAPVRMDKNGNRFLGWVRGNPNIASSEYLIHGDASMTWSDDVTEVTLYAVWTSTLQVKFSGENLLPGVIDHLSWRLDGGSRKYKSAESVEVNPGDHEIEFFVDEGYEWMVGSFSSGNWLHFHGASRNLLPIGILNDCTDSLLWHEPHQVFTTIDLTVNRPEEKTHAVIFRCSTEIDERWRNDVDPKDFPPFDESKVRINIGKVNGSGQPVEGTSSLVGLRANEFYYLPEGEYQIVDVYYDVVDDGRDGPRWRGVLPNDTLFKVGEYQDARKDIVFRLTDFSSYWKNQQSNQSFFAGGASAWSLESGGGGPGAVEQSAVQSGAIGDSESTWVQTTVSGPGTLSFDWKVSSEAGRDELHWYLDDVEQGTPISGEQDWEQVTAQIPAGEHVVKWVYTKDASGADGGDCGWVDRVEVVPPDPVAEFSMQEDWGCEGDLLDVRVSGGNRDRASSVKVYLKYTGASSADLDLGKTLIDGEPVNAKTFKFPVTLKWAKDEIGEKTITLRLKKDLLYEGIETFTLQLGGELGMTLGEQRTMTVAIEDEEAFSLAPAVKNPSKTKGVRTFDVDVDVDWDAGVAVGAGSYYKGTALTVKAKPRTGYVFSAWYDCESGKKLSTSANYTFTVAKDIVLEPRFSKRYYVRTLVDPVDGATVTGGGWFAKGKTATLKAATKAHFKFLGWYAASEDDSNVADRTRKLSGSLTYKPVVTNDCTVFACYQSEPRLEIFKTSGGTVSGANKYAQGKTATLTAKVSKGCAFLGWYDSDGKLVSQATTYKYKMGAEGVVFNARFAKESELAVPVLDWNASTNLPVGVAYTAKPKVSAEAAVKIVSVSGLPKGLTYKSGKVSGAPTTVSTNTVSVKIALTTNAKKTWTLKQKLVVEPLPLWAVGTFDGGSDAPANQVKLTVSSVGKVSGKMNFANASWTLSGTKIAKLDRESRTATVSLSAKKGTATKAVTVVIGEDALGGYATSTTPGFIFEARQNLWKKDATWSELAAELVGTGIEPGADDLTVVLGANGTVTAKLKVGKNTFSCSAVLCPTEFVDGKVQGLVYLYFAPNTAKKFRGTVRVIKVDALPKVQP